MQRSIEAEMGFLSGTGTSQEIVENVETPFTSWYLSNAAALEPMVNDLSPYQSGVQSGGCIVLQLTKQAGFRGGRSGQGFGGCQCVEDKGSVREFGRERC